MRRTSSPPRRSIVTNGFRRTRAAALALLLSLPLTACLPEAPSVHPLLASKDRIERPEVVGDWVAPDDTKISIADVGDTYELSLPDDHCPPSDHPCTMKLTTVFGRLGDQMFVDLTSSQYGDLSAVGIFPVHAFGRVRLSEGRLEIAMMDGEWLTKALASGEVVIAHERIDSEDVVLTAPTEELQQMMTTWSYHPAAFPETVTFVRPGAAHAGQ
jgi:hypothetical protein